MSRSFDSIYFIYFSYVVSYYLVIVYILNLSYVSNIRSINENLIFGLGTDIPGLLIYYLDCSFIYLILISDTTNTLNCNVLDEISKVFDQFVGNFRSIKSKVNYCILYEVGR